jgi:hypothetical protein
MMNVEVGFALFNFWSAAALPSSLNTQMFFIRHSKKNRRVAMSE